MSPTSVWDGVSVCSVSLSFNRSLSVILMNLETSMRRRLGTSLCWGTSLKNPLRGIPPVDAREEAAEEWAASLGLSLLIRGSTSTRV